MKQSGKIAVVLIGLASGAAAQDCNSAALDQSTMNICAHQGWERADKELNRAYKLAKAALRCREHTHARWLCPALAKVALYGAADPTTHRGSALFCGSELGSVA